MKRIATYLFAALAAGTLAAGAAACSESGDEAPLFAGSDNRIAAFGITTAGGVRYEAAIRGEIIEIEVPEGVSLSPAAADYALCEQAILYPDPAGISDWGVEHRFRAEAYDGSCRDYTYTVRRLAVTAGSVTLLTQSDVEAFGATGATIIEGDLIIGSVRREEADPVTDLTPLAGLAEVRYNIIVNNSFAGSWFELPALKHAGAIIMGTGPADYQSGFTANMLVTEQLFDVSCPELESLGQFSAVSDCVRSISLPALRQAGSIHIASTKTERITLNALTCCSGDLAITYSGNTGAIPLPDLHLPNLQTVGGSLHLYGLTSAQAIGLGALTEVGKNLTISMMSSITALSLPELTAVGGKFATQTCNNVRTLELPKLREAGELTIAYTASSSQLEVLQLDALEEVGKGLSITTALHAEAWTLPRLRRVGGGMTLSGGSSNGTFECRTIGLPALTEVGGTLALSGMPLLASIDLSSLETPLQKFTSTANYQLARIRFGSAGVENIALNGGSRLCDFPRFEGIDRIEGQLEVSNFTQNDAIAYPGLRHIGTYIQSTGKSNGATTLSFPDLETMDELRMTAASWLGRLELPRLTALGKWNTGSMLFIERGDIAVPVLRQIGVFIFTGGNASTARSNLLTALDDFAALTAVGEIDIRYWGRLTDYSGLRNVDWNGVAKFTLSNNAYNPTLDDLKAGRYTQP